MIKHFIRSTLALFGIQIRKDSSTLLNRLSTFGIPLTEWEKRETGYYLNLLDITVQNVKSPLITRYDKAKQIVESGGGRFSYDDQGRLLLSIQDVNFFIHFPDELYVINEVFVTGEYNFRTKDEIVVIDIGLNIGATSLFFSKQPNVKKIYAYELFQPTYLVAQNNFSLNNTSKINSFNVGLGKEKKHLQLPYSPTNKARMGLNGLPPKEKFDDTIDIPVYIEDVAEEVIKISQLEPSVTKLCKMDCEGAEYEILDHLFLRETISLIDIYLIEWHVHDTQSIELQFLKNGFDVIKSNHDDSRTGLLYAVKRS